MRCTCLLSCSGQIYTCCCICREHCFWQPAETGRGRLYLAVYILFMNLVFYGTIGGVCRLWVA